MLFVAWFFLIRPQQRRMRAHQEVVSTLDVGDEVMTTSGIFGTIKSMDGDVLRVEVAPGIQLRMVKNAIARRIGPDAGSDAGQDEGDTGSDAEAASAAEE